MAKKKQIAAPEKHEEKVEVVNHILPKWLYSVDGAHLCKSEKDLKELKGKKLYESPADVPKKVGK